jgi:hypothetical protein
VSKSFKRKLKVRRLKKTYLVVCEGACEELYFKGLKRCEQLKNINVEVINPSISTPYEIFRYAGEELMKREYDAVFCVIDGDVLGNKEDTGKKARRKGVTAIVSRPCFELWFLLHYKYTSREFHNCGELISKELLKFIPDYEKSKRYHAKKYFYIILKASLETAMLNAGKLENENMKNNKPTGTSTDIYKLVKQILQS